MAPRHCHLDLRSLNQGATGAGCPGPYRICGAKEHDVTAIAMNKAIQIIIDIDLYVFF